MRELKFKLVAYRVHDLHTGTIWFLDYNPGGTHGHFVVQPVYVLGET